MGRIDKTQRLILAALVGAGLGGIAVSQGRPPATEMTSKTDDRIHPSGRDVSTKVEAKDAHTGTVDILSPTAVTGGTAPVGNQIFYSAPTAGQALEGPSGAAAVAAPGATAKTAGMVCKPAVSGSGEGKFQDPAQNKAKANWQNVAAGIHGGVWDWNKASGHAMSCRHNGLGPIERRWTCTATAEPCEEVINCKPAYVQVEGASAKLQSGAEENAVNQWQHDAGNAHGAAFKYWSKAANQTSSCRHNGLGPIQRRWRCTLRARPCD